MNKRQTKLIQKLLLHTTESIRVQYLADELDCSEKTIRNDLKVIEQFLSVHGNAELSRKPGIGLHISISEEDKRKVFHELYRFDWNNEHDRLLEIGYRLLVEEKPLTLQGLADSYFATPAEIRNDMVTLSKWLYSFGLEIISKQRLGSTIQGKELDKRNALAHLPELVTEADNSTEYILQLFPKYETDLVRQSITRMLKQWAWELADDEVESLTIHALVMMKRVRQSASMVLTEEEIDQAKSSQEYQMTENFLTSIKNVMKLELPQSEKVYFTWHLMSFSHQDLLTKRDTDTDRLMSEVVNQLTAQLQIMTMTNFRNDPILMDGLNVHLSSTIHRVRHGLSIRNPMLNEIKKMYPYMFSMMVMALEEVNKTYSIVIPEDEAAYLVLHFQASVERLQKKRDIKKKVLIVCELGVGMSHLLQAKLEQSYKGMEIVDCIGVRDLDGKLKNASIDFILSTRDLGEQRIPTLVISPLLKAEDRKKLDQFLQKDAQKPLISSDLWQWLNSGTSHFEVEPMHRYQVIEMLGRELVEKKLVSQIFPQRAVMRERTSSTAIGGGIAIPHAPPGEVYESNVSTAVLKEPIEWGNERVSVVFLLAISKEDQTKIRSVMHIISRISSKPELVQEIIEAADLEDLKQVLK
ncbi:activator of the mannose operon, transcriptional antiterminator [Halobacillus alkaliphilus]|uniref:Activator of the mannose operon, transcriptional antiterminator n=1 Tax=Halobacillus alkaliphilus TaxID=396056 RepID=A0A1I2JR08_9BACI|nr:BglG family transcription antiterminator [Halobacillus alkaliphilus]SFF57014.1 activator of the mannose operon, transcriptional antiterminator [Halobacillus alkaliphilus]